jgi:hypothetical protein
MIAWCGAPALTGSALQNLRLVISFACFGIALTALLPKTIGNDERIDLALQPPLSFLAGRVDAVVVNCAKRDSELIAYL